MMAVAREVVAGGEVYRNRSGWAHVRAAGRLSPKSKCFVCHERWRAHRETFDPLPTGCSWTFCDLAAASHAEAKSHTVPRGFISDSLPLAKDAGDPFQILVREATLADYWEVADTHCGAFLPELVFPMDAIMRMDRVLAMVGGLPLPAGCQRKCLVAVSGQYRDGLDSASLLQNLLLGLRLSRDQSQNDNQLPSVLGVITVDTLADFIPRRKSTGGRRYWSLSIFYSFPNLPKFTIHQWHLCHSCPIGCCFWAGIAYISNVAVRQMARRQGIGKRLVQEAEILASQWGCRSIALHCNEYDLGALALYVGAGYKVVKAPVGAKWPQPKAATGLQFGLMLKRLGSA